MPLQYSKFDMDSKSFVEKYPFSDDGFGCTSQNFTSLDKTKGEGFFLISYDQYIGTEGNQIVIECHNWRNPIIPESLDGF